MSDAVDQTTAGGDVEMSEDSGYTGSCFSPTSGETNTNMDTRSESGVSTDTLVDGGEAVVNPEIKLEPLDSGVPSWVSGARSSTLPGQDGVQRTVKPEIKLEPSNSSLTSDARSSTLPVQGASSNLTLTNVAKVDVDETSRTEKWVFDVFVKSMEGKTHVIKVEKSEDVSEFRKKVFQKLGVPGEQQRLVTMEGKPMEDGRSLCEYNIKENSTINCFGRLRGGQRFEVFVKNLDGKPHVIEVEENEDVSEFRQKVCQKLGVPAEQQRLTSQEGKTLEDGRPLCDYNIKKHTTIYCQGRLRGGQRFEVFVKNMEGKPHVIEVEENEDVSEFRQKVCQKLGVPAEQQRLTSQEGKTLEDGRPLCDYNIKKHTTIYCQGRLRGGQRFEVFVKNLDGKPHVIEVEENEDVSEFRQKVCETLGVPVQQQRLTSQEGRTLEDGRPLCDYNIKKHTTIYCQGPLRGVQQ